MKQPKRRSRKGQCIANALQCLELYIYLAIPVVSPTKRELESQATEWTLDQEDGDDGHDGGDDGGDGGDGGGGGGDGNIGSRIKDDKEVFITQTPRDMATLQHMINVALSCCICLFVGCVFCSWSIDTVASGWVKKQKVNT